MKNNYDRIAKKNASLLLGITSEGKEAYASPDALNFHKTIVGMSGTGKSLLMAIMMVESAIQGIPTIVINWKNTLRHEDLPKKLRETYESIATVLNVAEDNLQLPLFSLSSKNKSQPDQIIYEAKTLLANAASLKPQETTRLTEAVETAYSLKTYQQHEAVSIYNILKGSDKATSLQAAEKLAPLLMPNCLREGDFLNQKYKILEIDLNGLESRSQKIFCYVILEYLNKQASDGRFLEEGLNLFVDESHNLDFTQDSTIDTLLKEKRKEGLNIHLATTNLETTGKKKMNSLQQAGFQFYFKPAPDDIRKVSNWINPSKTDSWTYILSTLERGHYVVCGTFEINGLKYSGPIMLSTPTSFYE